MGKIFEPEKRTAYDTALFGGMGGELSRRAEDKGGEMEDKLGRHAKSLPFDLGNEMLQEAAAEYSKYLVSADPDHSEDICRTASVGRGAGGEHS